MKIGKDTIKVILKTGDIFQWGIMKIWMYNAYKEIDVTKSNFRIVDDYFYSDGKADDFIFTYKGKQFNLKGTKNNGALLGVFIREEYSFLHSQDEDVIDIGSNIGDSSIYFAMTGAKRVIALEPYPYSYSLAESNVKNNDLGNIITLLNAGYGNDGTITVSENYHNIGSVLVEFKNGKRIPIHSLKSLIEQYNLQSPVLKMDCEGWEYNLLNEADDVIRKFKRIQIEYHYGYEKLVHKLKEIGFECNYTEPKKVYNGSAGKTMVIGYVYAQQPVK